MPLDGSAFPPSRVLLQLPDLRIRLGVCFRKEELSIHCASLFSLLSAPPLPRGSFCLLLAAHVNRKVNSSVPSVVTLLSVRPQPRAQRLILRGVARISPEVCAPPLHPPGSDSALSTWNQISCVDGSVPGSSEFFNGLNHPRTTRTLCCQLGWGGRVPSLEPRLLS